MYPMSAEEIEAFHNSRNPIAVKELEHIRGLFPRTRYEWLHETIDGNMFEVRNPPTKSRVLVSVSITVMGRCLKCDECGEAVLYESADVIDYKKHVHLKWRCKKCGHEHMEV